MNPIIIKISNLVDARIKSAEQIKLNIITTTIITATIIIAGLVLITKTSTPELTITIIISQIASLMALATVLKEARKDKEQLDKGEHKS